MKRHSREISFAQNVSPSRQIVLIFLHPEHGSIIAILYANIQNDMTTDMDVLDERDSRIWV